MRLVEKVATFLNVLGIPTGKLCPHIFVADVCGHFVAADLLSESGTVIPGREWSTHDLREATLAYTGIDFVTEVLSEEMRPGLTVESFWAQRANWLREIEKNDPSRFKDAVDEISSHIVEAQRRLASRRGSPYRWLT